VWYDAFICVPSQICTCGMTHSYVCHHTSVCVRGLIHMCDMTLYMSAVTHSRHTSHTYTLEWYQFEARLGERGQQPTFMGCQLLPVCTRKSMHGIPQIILVCPFSPRRVAQGRGTLKSLCGPSDRPRVPTFAQTRCTRKRQTEENVSSVCNEGEFGQQSMCRTEWQRPIGCL